MCVCGLFGYDRESIRAIRYAGTGKQERWTSNKRRGANRCSAKNDRSDRGFTRMIWQSSSDGDLSLLSVSVATSWKWRCWFALLACFPDNLMWCRGVSIILVENFCYLHSCCWASAMNDVVLLLHVCLTFWCDENRNRRTAHVEYSQRAVHIDITYEPGR